MLPQLARVAASLMSTFIDDTKYISVHTSALVLYITDEHGREFIVYKKKYNSKYDIKIKSFTHKEYCVIKSNKIAKRTVDLTLVEVSKFFNL